MKANMKPLQSRRAMLDTLMRHLDMVRLSAGVTATIATLTLVLGGCTGLIGGNGDGNLTPEQLAARAKWTSSALPVFKTNCVSCHAGSDPATAFLQGTTDLGMRETLLGFDPQVVNLEAAESSRVLTKGSHAGPALDATQTSAVLVWIQAEKDAAMKGNTGPQLETAKFTPKLCTGTAPVPGDASDCGAANIKCCPINNVPLDDLGLVGAEIDFVAQPLSDDLYVTDLYLKASTDGVYLEHPLFSSWDADTTPGTLAPIPDKIDRFFSVKLNLAQSPTAPTCPGPSCSLIANGAAAFVGFRPNRQISISFKMLEAFHPDTMPPPAPTGCGTAGFASFLTNVKPVITTCQTQCHGGTNQGAKNAMDLSGLASATDNNTCLQVRAHVNFQTVGQSGVLLAPDPAGDAAHPFKLSAASTPTLANFQTALNTWITVEGM